MCTSLWISKWLTIFGLELINVRFLYWITNISIANNQNFSRYLKVDQNTGAVLSAFQLTSSLNGFNLYTADIYFISNDELLISANGNKTYNKIGLTDNSQIDAIILKVNITSRKVISSTICDIQNGIELVSNIVIKNNTVYQFGIKDDLYIFIKAHDISTLNLINQKVFFPSTSNVYTGYASFQWSGILGDLLITIYTCYLDNYWIFVFDKTTLSLK